MKTLTLPTGGLNITTLALMLLLIVTACENDDQPHPINTSSVTTLEGNYQVVVQTDGSINKLYQFQNRLYAAGSFSTIDGVAANGIASYDGNSWSALGSGLQPFKQDDIEIGRGYIIDMIEYKGDLYVAGEFAGPGGIISPSISRWDGNAWGAVPGLDPDWMDIGDGPDHVNRGIALEIFQDELYIGGHFSGGILGQSISSTIKWNGNSLSAVQSPLIAVGELEVYNNHLYAIGDGISGEDDLHGNNMTRFDGSDWSEYLPIGEGIAVHLYAINMTAYQEKLFISPNANSGIRTWDGIRFVDLKPEFSPEEGIVIWTMEMLGNTLYIGGTFDGEVLGTHSNGIVTWDGHQWGVIPDGPKATIHAIQQFQNQLFVAGYFDGQVTSSIAVLQIQ